MLQYCIIGCVKGSSFANSSKPWEGCATWPSKKWQTFLRMSSSSRAGLCYCLKWLVLNLLCAKIKKDLHFYRSHECNPCITISVFYLFKIMVFIFYVCTSCDLLTSRGWGVLNYSVLCLTAWPKTWLARRMYTVDLPSEPSAGLQM